MIEQSTPRIEIHLNKITHNAKMLKRLFAQKGVKITGVIKGGAGSIEIARAVLNAGIHSLADSRIKNIKKFKKAGLNSSFMLLRIPALSEVSEVVQYADISLNSDLDVIHALSREAKRQNKIHKIILMVEMGDLREGILPEELPLFLQEVLKLEGVEVIGLGTNFACFGGIVPTDKKMKEFSMLVRKIRKVFHLELPIISGGNSANYNWFIRTNDVGEVNNLRLGESILLGKETVDGTVIPGLYNDAFRLVTEIIELKRKPSVPYGQSAQNAFGEKVHFKDKGMIKRGIVNIGRQDVIVSGLRPLLPVDILGSSSDHIVLDTSKCKLKLGDTVSFSVDYGAMLSAMTSPYVVKKYIPTDHEFHYGTVQATVC